MLLRTSVISYRFPAETHSLTNSHACERVFQLINMKMIFRQRPKRGLEELLPILIWICGILFVAFETIGAALWYCSYAMCILINLGKWIDVTRSLIAVQPHNTQTPSKLWGFSVCIHILVLLFQYESVDGTWDGIYVRECFIFTREYLLSATTWIEGWMDGWKMIILC